MKLVGAINFSFWLISKKVPPLLEADSGFESRHSHPSLKSDHSGDVVGELSVLLVWLVSCLYRLRHGSIAFPEGRVQR